MKKFLSIILAVAMILSCTIAFAEETVVEEVVEETIIEEVVEEVVEETAKGDISVEIDGKAIAFDVAPIIVEGRTLVPLRAIFEELGAVVNWDDETKTVSAFKENTSVVLQIGTPTLFVGNESKPMDVPAQIVSDRTLVPLRAVSEAFGCEVNWNGDEKKVTITTGEAVVEEVVVEEVIEETVIEEVIIEELIGEEDFIEEEIIEEEIIEEEIIEEEIIEEEIIEE